MNNLITIRVRFPSGTKTYDYAAPADLPLKEGDRVLVPSASRNGAEVVEVLAYLTKNTTHGIIGKVVDVDNALSKLVAKRVALQQKVDDLVKRVAMQIVFEADPSLKKEMEELGML